LPTNLHRLANKLYLVVFMTVYHHSIYCDLIHNEDATNQNKIEVVEQYPNWLNWTDSCLTCRNISHILWNLAHKNQQIVSFQSKIHFNVVPPFSIWVYFIFLHKNEETVFCLVRVQAYTELVCFQLFLKRNFDLFISLPSIWTCHAFSGFIAAVVVYRVLHSVDGHEHALKTNILL
jgi:hypothetical protein